MSVRDLPARPDLDHLKNEAKALCRSFRAGDVAAGARIGATIGARDRIRLADAQRALAREYGFPNWARLRAHVLATRDLDDVIGAFLGAVANQDCEGALTALRAEPRIAQESLHVAAVLGREGDVRRLLDTEDVDVHRRIGRPGADALLWLCHSPFHGETPERAAGLLACARVLLDAGADPNTRDEHYGVPALYAVTGVHEVPAIARVLLDAGAEPTDGESAFHAAERFHVDALDLLLEYGVDLNATGEWGNTPLYFLLRHHDVAGSPRVRRGFDWLLDHGADPNVLCGREQETALHIAARRAQHPEIVALLLDRGADPRARRGDGRTAWTLAMRGGLASIVAILEAAGATPEPLAPVDGLMAACGEGDASAARALASPEVVAALQPEDIRLLPEAASGRRAAVVDACIAAGWPVDAVDDIGATALHHAAIHGAAGIARALLRHAPDLTLRDGQHDATPLGWACFGADHIQAPEGDYAGTVRALLEAGALPMKDDHRPADEGVRAVLEELAPDAD